MTMPPDRRRLFLLIAFSIPFIVLLLSEGALRLAGFGDDYPLFIAVPGQPAWLQPNPVVVERFFAHPEQAPAVSVDTGFFRAVKADGGLRIVVQGGSSAAGFPYGKHASLAGHLQQRLTRSFPGTDVEVILTAMAAVNSYAMVEFADEIVAIDPDAVVIYAGHNEFLGILGVGSNFGPGGSAPVKRLVLRLRELRLFQFVQRVIGALRPAAPRDGSLMARTARERSIALDSPLFEAGVEQFRSNLERLLARYARAGIPVFIGTLASNEKDQAPFLGSPQDAQEDWTASLAPLRSALAGGATDDARMHADALRATHPDAADAHYWYGLTMLQTGAPEAARNAFVAAIDHDRLRFRAPSVFETVIREAAATYGAQVVESHARLAASSADAIIGNELMLEHLHPNAEGYFLLADVFYEALARHGLDRDWTPVGAHTAHAEQPLTRIEKLHGEYRVARLVNDWPFVTSPRAWQPPPPDNEEQRIAQAWLTGKLDWFAAMNAGLVATQRSGDYVEAARIAVNIATALPFEAQPQHVAGTMLVRQQPPDGLRALPFFHRAATLDPTNVEYLVTLTRAYWLNGFRDAARQAAQRLQRVAPNHPATREVTDFMERSGS